MPRDERARTPADVPVSEMERLALAGARARGHLRRPLLRARDDLVAVPGGGNHPLGLGRRDAAASASAWSPASGPATPTPTTCRWPAMARAAETAAHIAHDSQDAAAAAGLARARRPALRRDERRRAVARRADRPRRAGRPRGAGLRPAHREGVREPRRADAPGADRELARRAGRGRAAAVLDPRERHRERQGRAARGLGRRRRAARAGVLRDEAARALRARGGAHGGHAAGRGRGAGRDRCRWCWRPAGPGSCCTRRSATASRATSTARGSRPSPAGSASAWRRRA